MSGGGSSPPSQTVTQVQDIPAWAQQAGQQNYQLAESLASQPYPTYQGQLIAGFTPQQQAGLTQASTAANSYQPDLSQAENYTNQAAQAWNPQTAQQYMSPYAQAALAPQIQAMQQQLAQQQLATNANATEAGAFGDARNGVANALNNYYGGLNLANIEATGMNQAYNTGLSAYQAQQGVLGQAGSQLANIGAQQQALGETGAQAQFGAGSQQQQLTQQQLTEAYNNFMNQVMWPTQGLNMQISALANTPYTVSNYTTLPPANSTASNLGGFSSITGLLGNLLNSGGGSSGGKGGDGLSGSTNSTGGW